MKLQDKIFVVTGAGGGIGSELVGELLTRGAKVAAIDLRPEYLSALQTKLNNPNLSIFPVDITDKDLVDKLPEQIIQAHGSVDAIVNCAGIIQPFVKVNDLDYEAIDRVMKVNFFGALYVVKAFLPHLLIRPEAYIVNFSSMGGFLPVPGQSVYGASKAAIKLLSEGLYAELRGTSVHVTTVFPGATETAITKNSGVSAPSLGENVDAAKKYKMLSPKVAAIQVVNGIENNKPQIFTGSDSKIMNFLYRVNPVYATNMITNKMKDLLK